MKGCYILILRVGNTQTLRIGKRGEILFQKGFYAYVGSAMNSLEGRIRRHLSKKKRRHWHIDYLLEKGKIVEIYIKTSKAREECAVANQLSKFFRYIPYFGSTDCNCISHLFYSENLKKLREEVEQMGFERYSIST